MIRQNKILASSLSCNTVRFTSPLLHELLAGTTSFSLDPLDLLLYAIKFKFHKNLKAKSRQNKNTVFKITNSRK